MMIRPDTPMVSPDQTFKVGGPKEGGRSFLGPSISPRARGSHGRLPHVVDLPRDVRVMSHHHLSAGVPQQFRNLGDAHAVDQRIRGEAMSVGVGDQPLQVGQLLP